MHSSTKEKCLFIKELFKNRFVKNTSWMLFENAFRIIASMFVGIWVARSLGPANYGTYSFVSAFIAIFINIAQLGLNDIIVRTLVRKSVNDGLCLGTAFYLKFVCSSIVILLAAIISKIIYPDEFFYIVLVSTSILFQSFEVIDFYFKANVKAKYVSICKILQLVVSSIFKIIFILTGANLLCFFILIIWDNLLLATSLSFAYSGCKIPSFLKCFSFKVAIQLLRESWPLLLSGIVVILYMKIDQLMLKAMLGEELVGVYSVAISLSEVGYFIPTVLCASLSPALIESYKISSDVFDNRFISLIGGCYIFSLIVILAVFLLGDWGVNFLFGNAYAQSATILKVHIVAFLPVCLGCIRGQWLLAQDLQHLKVFFEVTCCILKILGNVFFISRWGALGAAYATVVVYCTLSFVFVFILPETRKLGVTQFRAFNMSRVALSIKNSIFN